MKNEFQYTLDFTNVRWNTSLDIVEDFFANHKSGHCEYYALRTDAYAEITRHSRPAWSSGTEEQSSTP